MTVVEKMAGEVERLRKALHAIANVRPIGGHCHDNSTCGIMEGIATAALATQPSNP